MYKTDPNCLPTLTMTAEELQLRRLQALVMHMNDGTDVPVIVARDAHGNMLIAGLPMRPIAA
jgi:hypothetical protein